MLTYCIKELDGEIFKGKITRREILEGTFDKRIMKECIKDMMKFDRLVVYFGGDMRFDVPFLRTRAIYHNLYFPIYKELKLFDLYPVVKRKLKLTRNTLLAACSFFGIPAKQHQMEYQTWMRAMTGDKEALDHIMEHNIEDVESTEALWKRIIPYSNIPNSSL